MIMLIAYPDSKVPINEIILKINQAYSIFEADKLHSELRILDWIFYQVCRIEIKG